MTRVRIKKRRVSVAESDPQVYTSTLSSALISSDNLLSQSTQFDYYISTTGSDSNDGLTPETAWAITALNSKRATYAGHSVGVLPGTYDMLAAAGGSYTGSFAAPYFNIAGGTAGNPTIIKSTTPRGAILDGGATFANNPDYVPLIGSYGTEAGDGYCYLDGFEILNTVERAVVMGRATGAPHTSRTTDMRVLNCYVHDMTSNSSNANPTGITMYATDGAIVSNCKLDSLTSTSDRIALVEFWSCINSVAEYITGTAAEAGGGGILFKNNSQWANTVRYCYLDFSGYEPVNFGGVIGVDMQPSQPSEITNIHNNVVIGDNPISYEIIGDAPGWDQQMRIFNNTFVADADGFDVACVRRFGTAGTLTFFNNIISNTSGTPAAAHFYCSESQLALIDYNCYPTSYKLGLTNDGTKNYPDQTFTSLATWAAALPSGCVGKDAHSIADTPDYVATGSGALYYALDMGSPCIGTGSTDGTTGGSACDMGAWGGASVPTRIGSDF